eukprot:CAMPEP_0179908208 /NCGR_PEP_ID=MMETSP0982-20121206/44385_1 /TAXON_ID=483367 /ORGANISM="non described non described, Strain CCMP 2436" /LENGTH=91 /DNA_ID=CAMNT_0021809227 /DNA_START=256 /DNA_END=528 /DNA_ORIENTATION=-
MSMQGPCAIATRPSSRATSLMLRLTAGGAARADAPPAFTLISAARAAEPPVALRLGASAAAPFTLTDAARVARGAVAAVVSASGLKAAGST